jgi:hypothetical protein
MNARLDKLLSWIERRRGWKMIILPAMIVCVFALGLLSPAPYIRMCALAQDYIGDDIQTPDSAEQLETPIQLTYRPKQWRPGLFPWLKEKLKETPPFFRDTKLNVNLRTYYFNREKYDDSTSSAWAIGGSLAYESGWFLDHFGIGAVLYTSLPLYGPNDKDGTLLLKEGQDGYTVLGQSYGLIKLVDNHLIKLYRSSYDTPYINPQDNRMTPNTFEGYTIQGAFGGKEGSPGLKYIGGYISEIKQRNADKFIPMSEAAGVDVTRGVVTAGALFSYGGFSIGAINYYSEDIINIFYSEAKQTWKLSDTIGLNFAAQFTNQASVGDDLITGSSFHVNQFGLRAGISYRNGVFTVGYTNDSRGADLRSPWGGYPGYNSVQVQDFNRAGEQSIMGKLSYDFTRLGLEGLTAYALYVHGWNRVDPTTKKSVSNENEFDADLQWKPKQGFLKGIWFRVRYAVVHQYEEPKNYIHDFRFIVNYDFSLL